ncbi:TRAP transporter substrate-binding protein [Marinilactibacillus kalidii]|uniref:TRAP transporter substrate-binding protein n=1 Tax=Marinilactibacillus kalidii TaxID=2820274 RepID=UPI001ABE59A2
MLKKIGLCLLFLAVPVLNGCSATSSAKDVTVFRFAYASNSQPVKDSMALFGELVEEKSNGEMVVEYFPDSQLGGETDLIQLTQTGAIDFTKVSGAALEGFSETYSIFGIPYLFEDEESFFKVMEDESITKEVYESTSNLGFSGITYYDGGQRSFYMADGPVESPDDLVGKRIRTMESETAVRMMSLLGGSAVPMGSDEVYASLQSGLIDGSENNEFVLVTAGHGNVANYYSYDQHTRIPDIIIMNDKTRENLKPEQQEIIMSSAKESTEYQKEVFNEAIENEKQQAIEQYNVQFNEVDKAPFRELVKPIAEDFANDERFSELYQAIIDAQN